MLRRFFAILLITLVASPFTAPFSTCDLSAVDAPHQASDFVSAAKAVQDTATAPAPAAGGVVIQAVEPFHVWVAVFYSDVSATRPLVLRL